MENAQEPNQLLVQWQDDLHSIYQNRLLDEGQLIRFASERGIAVSGVVTGDPSRLLELGWLSADDRTNPERPRFHPFRLYPLCRIIEACRLHISATSSIEREHFRDFVARASEHLPPMEFIGELAAKANKTSDLAILLEPLYWPTVTSRQTWDGYLTEEEHERRVQTHAERMKHVLAKLDVAEWRERHEQLRWEASKLDSNDDVYLLLRMSPWGKRERLKGKLGGALWLRHLAEVVRRGFEEVHGVKWEEEDRSSGMWFPGARERIYGSERPLDDTLESRRHVTLEFGLRTGSAVRWYLEGETEYFATSWILPRAAAGGIELVNMRGAIAAERGNAALKLADALRQDADVRRFSIISFDGDVPANVRTIRRLVELERVIGYVSQSSPDFELANFTMEELVEIVARLDEDEGASGDALRRGDWSEVGSGRAFEERYCALSERRPRSLKGEQWGVALARFAADHPQHPNAGELRQFIETVNVALRSRDVRYEYQRDSFRMNPATFAIERRPEGST